MTDRQKPVLDHTTARPLTEAEIDAFLARPLIARLATLGPDGPQVTPVWYEWDGTHLQMVIGRRSRKFRNLSADARIAVTVDETLGGLRFKAVIMEGEAELIDTPQDWARSVAERIYTRYLGPESVRLPIPQAMLNHDEHVVIRLRPQRVITWDDTHLNDPVE